MHKLKYLILILFNSTLLFSTVQKDEECFYYFYYDTSNNREILKTIPAGLPRNTDIKIVVDSLLKYLSHQYFYKVYDRDITNIKLNLVKIDSIYTKARMYKIATIDIIDTSTICMGMFFQGSNGGLYTYNILGTNIIQPHLTSSFLDGVIILYNGKPLEPLDHINLNGMLIPKNFRMIALGAINLSRKY